MRSFLSSNSLLSGATPLFSPVQSSTAVTSPNFSDAGQSILSGFTQNNCTLSNLFVKVSAAPGIGNSFTFELYHKSMTGGPEAPTGITVTIADAATSGSDSAHGFVFSSFAESLALRMTKNGAPPDVKVYVASTIDCIDYFMPIWGPRFVASGQFFRGISGSGTNGGAPGTRKQLFAVSGSLPYVTMNVDTAPNPSYWDIFCRKNDAIVGTDHKLIYNGISLDAGTIVPGDMIELQVNDVGAPATQAMFGALFSPTTANEMPIAANLVPASLAGGTSFCGLFSDRGSSADETDHLSAVHACVLSNFYVRLPGPPGTSKSITLTLRKNQADTALAVTVAGAFASSGQDLAHSVPFSIGDLASVSIASTGAPITPSWIAFGFRAVLLTNPRTQTGFAQIRASVPQAQTGIAVLAPAPTIGYAYSQNGFSSIQGRNQIAQTGIANISPVPVFGQPGFARLLVGLNLGTGWIGPWNLKDNG